MGKSLFILNITIVILEKREIGLLNCWEIGVWGYDHHKKGLGSLRMWKRYFSNWNFLLLIFFDEVYLEESRITIFKEVKSDLNFPPKVVTYW